MIWITRTPIAQFTITWCCTIQSYVFLLSSPDAICLLEKKLHIIKLHLQGECSSPKQIEYVQLAIFLRKNNKAEHGNRFNFFAEICSFSPNICSYAISRLSGTFTFKSCSILCWFLFIIRQEKTMSQRMRKNFSCVCLHKRKELMACFCHHFSNKKIELQFSGTKSFLRQLKVLVLISCHCLTRVKKDFFAISFHSTLKRLGRKKVPWNPFNRILYVFLHDTKPVRIFVEDSWDVHLKKEKEKRGFFFVEKAINKTTYAIRSSIKTLM